MTRLLLVAAVAAACGGAPSTPPERALSALGPLRLGMRKAELSTATRDARLDMFCTTGETALRFCERQNTGEPVQLAYAMVAGRATYLMRQARSGSTLGATDALVARWESRFGPSSTGTSPLPEHVRVFRYWYSRGGAYRAAACGQRPNRAPECLELAVEPSPASVGALVMSLAMDRWASDLVCGSWDELILARCTEQKTSLAGTPLAPDHVLRYGRVVRQQPDPPAGGRLLLETNGERFHYRIWQLPDSNLHGVVCWEADGYGGCREIVARFQPEEFLTVLAQHTL